MTHFELEAGLVERSGQVLDALGVQRPLILTSSSRRHLERLLSALSPRQCHVFDGARVHVPRQVVEAAARQLEQSGADGLVSLGGGSATGLGKALRLEHSLPFVAIPTTFSGSEATAIFGITDGSSKRTGRDGRVRPERVLYDPTLFQGLPAHICVLSACNALAHPVSTLSTDALDTPLDAPARDRAVEAAVAIFAAIADLADLADPERVAAARIALLRATPQAAAVLDAGIMGVHHRLAHHLGGRYGLEHSLIHSLLLPHTLKALLDGGSAAGRALAVALGRPRPWQLLSETLAAVGAPAGFSALGLTAQAPSEVAALGAGAQRLLTAAL
ncbi:MAG: iron-containing alcohol dehydrogenase [Myxococcales bacterium]|nr:iron-containing alcohol dehydrogenase [Myxococcales bacterium]